MKKHLSSRLFLVTAFLYFILSFALAFSVLHCISNFVEISSTVILQISLFVSLFLSIVVSIVETIIRHKQKLKENKLKFWINQNYPKLLIGYIILLFLLLSITNQAKWTTEEINDVLTIEWTIFGLSLAIFLVWNVLIVEYLRKKQPADSGKLDLIEKYKLMIDRRSFSNEIDMTFSTVIMLSINLVLLIVSSSIVYISHFPEEVFTQNLVCCAFFFSTNTITTLFFDILKPLKKDRNDLKTANQVTKQELDSATTGVIIQMLIEKDIQMINESAELTEEEKKKRINQCFDEWKSIVSEMRKEDSSVDEQKQDVEK